MEHYLEQKINQNPRHIVCTYFDLRVKNNLYEHTYTNMKSGGKYVTITGNVVKIDEYKLLIILEDKTEIAIGAILELEIV